MWITSITSGRRQTRSLLKRLLHAILQQNTAYEESIGAPWPKGHGTVSEGGQQTVICFLKLRNSVWNGRSSQYMDLIC